MTVSPNRGCPWKAISFFPRNPATSSLHPERQQCLRRCIREALFYIPVGGHNERFFIVCAIKAMLGDDGFQLWDGWYRQRPTYDSRESQAVWRSAIRDSRITGRVLFRQALKHGWQSACPYARVAGME